MTISRAPVLLIFAALLSSCSTAVSLPQMQSTATMAQIAVTHPAKVKSKTKISASKPPALKQNPVETLPGLDDRRESQTTPDVGSPEWKKEQAQDELKEKHLKQAIQGICRGC
jgi:hypothetical protein